MIRFTLLPTLVFDLPSTVNIGFLATSNSNLKKTAIKVERNIFDSPLCYIQTRNKSLKILGAIIRNTANLRKTL